MGLPFWKTVLQRLRNLFDMIEQFHFKRNGNTCRYKKVYDVFVIVLIIIKKK